MSLNVDDKPLFITDGALNVSPRIDVKMHILRNAIEFAKKIIFQKPRVAILSGTEDAIVEYSTTNPNRLRRINVKSRR